MNNPLVKAYMESELGFEWRQINRLYFRDKPKMYVSVEEATFLYDQHIASTRKTLETAKRELLTDVPGETNVMIAMEHEKQRQKLDQMISALERKENT